MFEKEKNQGCQAETTGLTVVLFINMDEDKGTGSFGWEWK